MALYQINQFAQTASTLKSLGDQSKTEPSTTPKEFSRINDPDLVDTNKYAENLANKPQPGQNDNQVENDNNMLGNQPIELDEFLKARKDSKSREFKRLQREQGFYFSDAMNDAILHEMRANEGYYLIGVNFNALFDLFSYSFYPESKPIYDEQGNIIDMPEGDILSKGDSMALVGEWIDKENEYDKLLKDQVGLRLDQNTVLKPEDRLNDKSRFKDIIIEARRYTGLSRKYLNPLALFNMVRILDKYKHSEIQWLRTATAIEIVYKYMNRGVSRQTFFASRAPLDEAAIMELDEFFKTDHLFMTLDEITLLKSELEFYRFTADKDLNAKPAKNITNTKTNNLVQKPGTQIGNK